MSTKFVSDIKSLCDEWNYSRNTDLSPEIVTVGSGRKVWWKCSLEHEWDAIVKARAGKQQQGCPYCANKRVLQGFNDLATTNPELLSKWDFQNNELLPSDFTAGSKKVVSWICDLGHKWVASITDSRKNNCPYCANKIILQGFNDLATIHPKIANEWADKNFPLLPTEVTPSSSKKVWWECGMKGHIWEALIYNRTKEIGATGCPYCSNKRILPGFNDLVTTHPKIASEWNFAKNFPKLPTEVSFGSGKRFWWTCSEGHDWETNCITRTGTKKQDCPVCVNARVMVGVNDLVTTHPKIASQWSSDNLPTKPQDVVAGSYRKFVWECAKEHTWTAQVSKRTSGHNCPVCSNKRVLSGDNDLSTSHPELTKQWCYDKNKDLLPSEIVSGSHTRVWWKCDKEHSWLVAPRDRVRGTGTGCPSCFNSGTSNMEKDLLKFVENATELSVENNLRDIIPPYEIDVYIPAKSIAIEFNGLYWHSESAGRGKDYHANKHRMCKDAGIQLITVWEDDWRDRRSVVESMIKHKLGVSSADKVAARKTKFVTVSAHDAETFLNNNHIQGFRSHSRNFGLINSSEKLVAVMSFSVTGSTASLDRYATSQIVVGGFTKLLKNSVKQLPQSVTSVITFADSEVSDGALYENNGFYIDKVLPPDYKYIYDKKRQHKFLFRKKRFESDPDLLFDPNMTEKELAELNGVTRIWDSGKIKYRKDI